jgi:hypothetical protein
MHPLTVWLRPIAVLTGSAALFAVIACSDRSICAQESGSILQPEEATGRPGILVMRNGKVVEGRILKSGDDYSVRSPQGGVMFVPGSLVSLHCENLREAYQKLRGNAQKQNSPAAHCALARWCITNKLTKDARTELDDALQLEPAHEEARNLLLRLNELLDPKRPSEVKVADSSSGVPPKTVRFATQEVESLGSLSREQAQQFTRRIQPILVNKCAGAGCHSADSETGFRLQRVVPGGDTSRIASERNLAEVLGQIDIKSPRTSPLLTAPRGNHGRRGRPIFGGPRGGDQVEELREWVRSVAKGEVAREKREGVASRSAGRVEQASGVAEPREIVIPIRRAEREETSDDSRSAASRPTVPDPFHVNRDPFDPKQFNRTAAGQGKRR